MFSRSLAPLDQRTRNALVVLSGAGVGLVVLATTVSMLAAFAVKAPCLAPWPAAGIPQYCYSDIQGLYQLRELGLHIFPYVHGLLVHGTGSNVFIGHGEIEYPVLTGVFTWLMALPVSGPDGFLLINVGVLGACGVFTGWLLARLAGPRALLFAAAPGVVLYGFSNWDLLSIMFAVLGIALWAGDRPYWAAFFLAVGGCVKLWPGFLILPLVAYYLARSEGRRATRCTLIGAVTAGAINLPFIVLNARGWEAPFVYQAAIPTAPNSTSIWDWDGNWLSTVAVNDLSDLLLAVGFAAVLVYGWRLARRVGTFPFVPCCAAMVCWYLVTAKDNSAQYVMWVLPFLVLMRLRKSLWWHLAIVSVVMYVRFLDVPHTAERVVLCGLTFYQAAVFLLVAVDSLRASRHDVPVTKKDDPKALEGPWGAPAPSRVGALTDVLT